MAKNKRKLATLHSFFEKKRRTDDVPEQINLVDAPPLVDEEEQVDEQEQVEETPHFSELYVDFINPRAKDGTTVEHHYRCDIFMVAVDQQAQELNCRFNKQATELLILCTFLDPSNSFRSFNIDNICSLASKFYPADFEEQERNNLRCQLRHYENDILTNPKFQNLTTISELCQQLAATGKSDDSHLIDRYIMFSDAVLNDLFF